ncbi:MAG TPA: sulfide dehydrogenase, partial [Chromatiales bacterium]|nr:sulfide dehydrogenase [Chromatiales bacterium]
KSGHAANTQAKMTAAAIALLLREQTLPAASWVNTCYSLVGPDYGISVAAVYTLADGRIVKVKGAGGVSPRRAGPGFRRQEAVYARGWYENITRDIFA